MSNTSFLKNLAERGHRIITMEELKNLAQESGINPGYFPHFLRRLVKEGGLIRLFRGIYTFPNSLLAGPPLHEYELLPYVATPSAVSYWNAMAFHGLTDQLIKGVRIISPIGSTQKNTSKYSYHINGITYQVIRVDPKFYFGIQKYFINEFSVFITDLERTLIDGLVRPELCGGFFEVIQAYETTQTRLNIETLVAYATAYGKSTLKRLGWILETLNIFPQTQDYIQSLPCTSVYKLDPSRPNQGEWLQKWNLKRNI